MRALVVVNPSATTTSRRTRDVLLSALRYDLELAVAETTHRGHATELGRQAREKQLDLVVAVGGDGTINELVNGILDTRSGDRQPDIAIVPGGSTNVLARNLGIPENPVEATGLLLDALREGRRRPLGLGRLDQRYFTFAAGVGFDADVVHAVEQARADGRKATPTLYLRTALRRFAAQRSRRHGGIQLEPGASADPPPALSVAVVSNCSPWTYFGHRPLRPTPQADFDSGLEVFGLTQLGLVSTLSAAVQMMSHRGPRGHRVVSLHDQHEFTLRSATAMPVQVDGDYLGEHQQVSVTSVPGAVQIVY